MSENENTEGFFIRRLDLEPYFDAITSHPIVKIKGTRLDKKTKSIIPEYDSAYLIPQSISFCYSKGFYPICIDPVHNKLVVLVNQKHQFPTYCEDEDSNPFAETREEIILTLKDNFIVYAPEFFTCILTPSYQKLFATIEDLDFKLVEEAIFEDLLAYVLDPRKIIEYGAEKTSADSNDKGLFEVKEESIAAEILDSVLKYAVIHRATDVHIENTGEKYVARVRIDGDLQLYPKPLPSKYYGAIINVIRTRSDIDIGEQFHAQDGQMQFNSQFIEQGKVSSSYDIRVSIIPEVNGKLNAVLRIQQKREFKTLDYLGFSQSVYDKIKLLCKEPHGLVLVTGPTGSGKTTSLYSIINELNKEDVKILTAEDPVEIKMVGITQVSINEKQGRTFPIMLRHFLRHDPDIILIGEIRDLETAKIAIAASNTGHLVLSTLHTNDAVSTVKRLTNMEGIDPAEFAFALKGVCSQRLIKIFNKKVISEIPLDWSHRKQYLEKNNLFEVDIGLELNKNCGEEVFPVGVLFGLDGTRFSADGITENFEGRTSITEYWRLGTKAQDMIFDGKGDTHGLTEVAIKEDGMIPMAVDGLVKVVALETSLDNLIKIVGVDSIKHNRQMIIEKLFKKV